MIDQKMDRLTFQVRDSDNKSDIEELNSDEEN